MKKLKNSVDIHLDMCYIIDVNRKGVILMNQKSARIYIVLVESMNNTKISQNGFWNYEEAKRFIKCRSDNPIEVSPFRFESDMNIYQIHDVRIS